MQVCCVLLPAVQLWEWLFTQSLMWLAGGQVSSDQARSRLLPTPGWELSPQRLPES